MSSLTNVVRQLRKERDQAQRRIVQLEEALTALTLAECTEPPEDGAVRRFRARNEGPCLQRLANGSLRPNARDGRNGGQQAAASEPIRAAFSTIPLTDILFSAENCIDTGEATI